MLKTAETVTYEIFREITRAVRQFEAARLLVIASPKVVARITEGFGLAPYAVATVTLGNLPKTSSGKVQRRKTRDLYLSGQLEQHPETP